MRVNANEEQFEIVSIKDKKGLFTCLRVDRKTVPTRLTTYEIRHDDNCSGVPAQVAARIFANHWGTILLKDKLELNEQGYLNLERDDFFYLGEYIRLAEFLKSP